MVETGEIRVDNLSKKGKKLVRRAINVGVDPSLVEKAVWSAVESSVSRRESLTSQNGGGMEVVNRHDLLELRRLTDLVISARRVMSPSRISELRQTAQAITDQEELGIRDINQGTGNPI